MVGRYWLAGAAVVYGLVGLGMSVSGCSEARARVLKKTPLREVAAKVVAVDPEKDRLVLQVMGELTEFRVDETTVYFLPGRQAHLSDLQEGQAVRAVYEAGQTPPLLQWIELVIEKGPLPGAAR